MVVFSDGVTETTNAEGEFFGVERLRDLLRDTGGRGAEALGKDIVRAVEDFRAEPHVEDDLSLVIARRSS